MIQAPPSDRERFGLRGQVKSVADEWSTTEFDPDGKILEWSGNTCTDVWSTSTFTTTGEVCSPSLAATATGSTNEGNITTAPPNSLRLPVLVRLGVSSLIGTMSDQ